MKNELIQTGGGGESRALTANDIRQQVNLIQEVMKDVMQEDQHYGVIPGCKKKTLYKPGAEKLSLTFRLRPIISNVGDIIINDLQDGHRDVHVFCHIFNIDGVELATGIGSCSTLESKFRYRGGEKTPTGEAVPKEYWNLKSEGNISAAQEFIGGEGFGVAKIKGRWEICELGKKMENPDIADTYNTVLKMAKKRAYIDGILSATAASDIFTQDIEEEDINGGISGESPAPTNGATKAGKPPVTMPEESPADKGDQEKGAPDIIVCEQCQREITAKIRDYSTKKFGHPLCMDCQKNAKK